MTEEAKKHFNFYKFASFPLGPICLIPIWYGVSRAVQTFIIDARDAFNAPWWFSWALFAFFVFATIIGSALYSYVLPKDGKTGHKIYILIAPEDFSDDKYITKDFKEKFENHLQKAPGDLRIVIPSVIKRETFNRTIEHYQKRNKKFWDSKRGIKTHKRLQGSLYIFGTLKRRFSDGKEKYIFNLSGTISYNDVNKDLTPVMKEELEKNFPREILINKEFELEEFEIVSDRFATNSEYLIGWAHLASGNFELAYRLHSDIYTHKKLSFFMRGALQNLPELLHTETIAILQNCKKFSKEFVINCIDKAETLFNDSDIAIVIARALLLICNDDSKFDSTLSHAQRLMNTVKINNINHDAIYASRAYISLLKHDYIKAESEYKTFFEYSAADSITSPA